LSNDLVIGEESLPVSELMPTMTFLAQIMGSHPDDSVEAPSRSLTSLVRRAKNETEGHAIEGALEEHGTVRKLPGFCKLVTGRYLIRFSNTK